MSQVFGYLCSDDNLSGEVLGQYGGPLDGISGGDRLGMGVGWLQDGRSLVRKHPRRKAESVEILSLLADVPGRALVGHVRDRQEKKAVTEDLQPFRFRNFVYAQVGMLKGSKESAAELKAGLPDHISRNIKGKSPEELFFHRFYMKVEALLSLTAKSEHPSLYAAMMAETLREWGAEGTACLAVTDRCLVAGTTGGKLYFRLIEGIEEEKEKPLFAGHKPKKVRHERFRALLVSGGPKVQEAGWEEVPPGRVIWMEGDWKIRFLPLSSEAPEE